MSIEELINTLYKDKSNYKGLAILKKVLIENHSFCKLFLENLRSGKLMPFGDEEFEKIKKQNIRIIDNFITVFKEGLNLGSCTVTSKQLSYSYDGVDLVSGIMNNLKGTENSENGEHSWMEDNNYIYDTTLMLKIDKSLAEKLGYVEENRIKSYELNSNPTYAATKEYTNDRNIRHL